MLSAIIIAHLAVALCAPSVATRIGARGYLVMALVPALAFGWLLTLAPLVASGGSYVESVEWIGRLGVVIDYRVGMLQWLLALIVTGVVRKDDRAPLGYELGVTDLQIVHEAAEYPITPKEHGVHFLLDHRHLWLRSARQHAILRIRAEVVRACREYFDSRGFVLFDAPILTPSACEGTTTLFETPYFDETAYLTQSGQLYNEANAMALGRVYCFGPTFRAEKSKTRRHLTEFWMVEPEMAYANLEDAIALAE